MVLFGTFIMVLIWKMKLSATPHFASKEEINVMNIGQVDGVARTHYNSEDANPAKPVLPEASVPSRCTSCGTTMREPSKVARPFFSKGTSGDKTGTCTVDIKQIPSLDAASRRVHVTRRQLLDPADPNSNNNDMDTYVTIRKRKAETLQRNQQQVQEA